MPEACAAGGRADPRVLIMAGVIIGAFANAVIMVVLANAPPNTVWGAVWWMMGSVADAGWAQIRWLAAYVLVVIVATLLVFAWVMDAVVVMPRIREQVGVSLSTMATQAQASLTHDLTELLQRFNQGGTDTLAVPSEYLEVVATRA